MGGAWSGPSTRWCQSPSQSQLLVSWACLEAGTETLEVPENLTLSPFTHWAVYTVSSLVEQSTPISLLIYAPSAARCVRLLFGGSTE